MVVGEGCRQGGSCGLELYVEFIEGEFVRILMFMFDTVHHNNWNKMSSNS